jgi:hypothetical protein
MTASFKDNIGHKSKLYYSFLLPNKALTFRFYNKTIKMITPDDILPPDDSEESEMDDQQSQRDIHSNGLDEDYEGTVPDEYDESLNLEEAYDASAPSYTLDFDAEEEEDYDD